MGQRTVCQRLKKAILFAINLVVLAVLLFPFVWMVLTSVKNPQDIYAQPPIWWPKQPTLENYESVLKYTDFPRWFRNSLIVSVATTAFSLLVSVPAAYTLARLRFPGKKVFGASLLYMQMIPHVLLVLPIFLVVRSLGLLNTYFSLIITYCTFTLPFSVWMLRGYFVTIPSELEEAARIDGCSRLGALTRIIMPLAAPGIAAVGIYIFIVAWEEYLFSLTLIRSADMRTLPVGVSMMLGDTRVLWGRLMAASVLVTIPVAAAFVYLQKYLVEGLTAGAVKG